jgi:hypothetical protein
MEEKFRPTGATLRSLGLVLPSLASLGVLLATCGCSSEGTAFGDGGTTGNPSNAGSGNPNAGNGNTSGSPGSGGNTNPGGGNGNTGGDGNTSGSGNPSGGNAGTPGGGGDGPMGGAGGTPPAETCDNGNENGICHEFFANDNARNQLNYINEFDPTKNWTKPVNDTTVNSGRQIELVDNANGSGGKAILISVNKGYQEYDMVTGERLVNVVLAGTTGIRGAVRLPSGNTLLAVGDNKLRVVDGNGSTVGVECTLPGAGGDSLRVLNRDSATGNLYLGRLLDLFVVSESCQQQWTAKLPAGAKAYSVFPRVGGGVWATTGAPSTVLEYDMAGQIVSQVGGKDVHPGIGLDFFSGFERLPNGNIVAANWQGHIGAPAENTPHLVEFTPASAVEPNKLVWQWGNQTLARQITNTLIVR